MKDKLNTKFIDSLNGFRIKFTDSKLTKKWVGKQDTGHWEIYFEGKLVETADHPEINKVMARLETEIEVFFDYDDEEFDITINKIVLEEN